MMAGMVHWWTGKEDKTWGDGEIVRRKKKQMTYNLSTQHIVGDRCYLVHMTYKGML